LYRCFLKKLAAGVEEDLEDPDFDSSFALPQKVVDVCEQEITLELTDKELVDWEKERKQALAKEEAKTKAEGMELEGKDIEEKKEEAPPPEKEVTEDEEAKEKEDDIGGTFLSFHG
jgi:ribosome-binding ATPase YchF (GTP1/OBG family)